MALTEPLERVVQEGVSEELVQKKRELVLGDKGDVFREGLTSEAPALALGGVN